MAIYMKIESKVTLSSHILQIVFLTVSFRSWSIRLEGGWCMSPLLIIFFVWSFFISCKRILAFTLGPFRFFLIDYCFQGKCKMGRRWKLISPCSKINFSDTKFQLYYSMCTPYTPHHHDLSHITSIGKGMQSVIGNWKFKRARRRPEHNDVFNLHHNNVCYQILSFNKF